MLNLIGNTPLIKLNKIKEELVLSGNIYAKLEMFNPTGSIKVRIAKAIIIDALKKGVINKETLIIEATSGNTGIALAFVCSCLGLKFMAVMPQNTTKEKIKIIEAYGGKVILTPKELGMSGALDYVKKISVENVFVVSQFNNPLNPLTHEMYTGPELYSQLNGNIDVIVCGIGSGGTITGIARYLKSKINVKIIGVEPLSSPLLSKGISGQHSIEGIGSNFIPDILDLSLVNEIITISDSDAYYGMRMLASKEGVFAGISSGAAFMCALELSKKIEYINKNIVVIFPDGGERYLSKISILNE